MGVTSREFDVHVKVSKKRLFKALAIDCNDIFPMVYSHVYKKMENISGSGGPGTIRKVHLAGQGHLEKRIEVLDIEKLEFSYTIDKGHGLGVSVEKIHKHIKIVEGPSGGSVIKITIKYHTKNRVEFKETHATVYKEKYTGLYTAVGKHLLENPRLCN